jgi:hypothetical protein
MARRSQIEHETDVQQLLMATFKKPGAEQILTDLYTLSLSTALAGYVYRSVEEMICKGTNDPLSESEKSGYLCSMYQEYGTTLANSEYRVLKPNDVVDDRLLFCLALRWDNRHLKYLLAGAEIQREWWATMLSQNIELAEKRVEQVYRAVELIGPSRGLSHQTKEMVRDGVVQDLLHGYIVKLVESLIPIQ